MSKCDPIIRRFYMKHMPEMLNVSSNIERQKVLDGYIQNQGSMLYEDGMRSRLSEFVGDDHDISHKEYITRAFGIGPNLFSHDELNAYDVPYSEFKTVYDLVSKLADIRDQNSSEQYDVDIPAWDHDEYVNLFNIWCNGVVNDQHMFFIFQTSKLLIHDDIFECSRDLIDKYLVADIDQADIDEMSIIEYITEGYQYLDPVHTKMETAFYTEVQEIVEQLTEDAYEEFKKPNTIIANAQVPISKVEDLTYHFSFGVIEDAKNIELFNWYEDIKKFDVVDQDEFCSKVLDSYRNILIKKVDESYKRLYEKFSKDNVVSIW